MTDLAAVEKEILKRRATDLARGLEKQALAEDVVPLLEFSLMGSRFAVRLHRVEAVTRIGEIFSIPLAPKHIPGIIRRRGQSLALVSLRHFFHARAEGIADADFALIVVAGSKRFALQVEEIVGVLHLSWSTLSPPPDNYDPAQAPYVAGVTRDGLSVLDLEALVEAKGFSTESAAV